MSVMVFDFKIVLTLTHWVSQKLACCNLKSEKQNVSILKMLLKG